MALPVPSGAAVVGTTIHAQAAVLTAGAPFAGGVALSQGLTCTIGY